MTDRTSPETETLHHVPEIFLFYRNKIFHHAHTDCRVFEKWLEKSPWLYPPDQCEIVRYVPAIPGLAQTPDLPDGYVLVPRELTAENGAKAFLSGEFSETFDYMDDEGDECVADIPVSWTTIKAIHKKMVSLFASPDTSTDHQLVLSAWKIVGYDKSEKLCWVMRPEQLLAAIAVSSPLRGNTK